MLKNFILLCAFLALSSVVYSQDTFEDDVQILPEDGYFDKPYDDLVHPIDDAKFLKSIVSRNEVEAVIEMQTEVKSQGARGTCSIFSATGLLEAILKREDIGDFDLSEEWLEYIVTNGKKTEGSNSYINFNSIKKYGTTTEKAWPYIGSDWTNSYHPLKEERCGKVEDLFKISCLLGHRDHALLSMSIEELNDTNNAKSDPEFAEIKLSVTRFTDTYLKNKFNNNSSIIYNTSAVKNYLNKKIPLTMGIQVHYGSWNHRYADIYGIGRDEQLFNKGIVTYPEYGSLDRKISSESGKVAGHSVIIVGYDDDRVVTSKMKMEDGSIKEFTYKGVYYFKNSWGTYSFGSDFVIDGANYPGYGMITQKYAHEFGSFYIMPFNYKK